MASSERTSIEQSITDRSGDIDLVAVGRVLWRYKVLIALTTVLATGVALYLALTAIPLYQAEVVVTAVSDREMSGASGISSQLGGLASLAGLNLANDNAAQEAAAVLESRRLVEEFIKRNKLLPQLVPDPTDRRSNWFAVKQFRDGLLSIRQDVRRGTTTLAVKWRDPAVAARWANDLVALANELIRTRALEESKRNIAYLNDQIERTTVVELRRVMFNLIESETKTLMLANGRPEYAFTVVDPAVRPEMRVSPRRTLMVAIGIAGGLLLGGLLAFGHDYLRRHRRPA